MDKISDAHSELRELDALAAGDSPVHRLNPICKLFVTVLYIAIIVSFPKYDFSGLIVMVIFPLVLFQVADIPIRICFYKLRYVLPFVCAVGIANPILDHAPLIQLGNVIISGGVVSMLTLMMKGLFSVMASFILIATTPIDALCAGLRKLHVPSLLVTLLLLTYRYIGVMLNELSVMTQAYKLRAPGQKGIHVSAWGSFLGQLLLRSMDRAEELYGSMRLRGFCGDFYYVDTPGCSLNSLAYVLYCSVLFFVLRFVNFSVLIGNLFVR